MDMEFAENTTIRATHIIEEVSPKDGVYNRYHDQVRGRPCVIFDIGEGRPASISVAMGADPGCLHMYHTSDIVKMERADGVTTIETLNTVYKIRLMNKEEMQDDKYVYHTSFYTDCYMETHELVME